MPVIRFSSFVCYKRMPYIRSSLAANHRLPISREYNWCYRRYQPARNHGFTAIVLHGQTDTVSRPPLAKDGSFLVFRQLEQLVLEFKKVIADHPTRKHDLPESKALHFMEHV